MPSLLACFGCGRKGESDDIHTLDYTHASLTDVPSDVFACERTLEELYLDSNQLSELPRQLFFCHGLRTLGLSDNELTSLPPAVATLINLTSIDLSKNAISNIPDNIKGCKQLSSVDASINPLCRLPEGFTQLLSLQELYLNDTFLEYLPANFGRLSRLRILELRENQLNTLPKSIARLTALQRLDIGQNDFSELPEVIGSLVNLTELWFDNNKVKSVPPLVGRLKKLTHVDACKNKVDWVAGDIENCTALTDLHLSSNNLKELPEQLGSCRALETLKVDDNALTCLPATLGGLVSLQELVASQNDLEDLPASVGLLRGLHTLHIDDNLLTDLPGELGSCCELRVLTAASNRLTSVPGELGHLPHLAVLNLCDNLLPHLPVSLTKLKLRALWLSENQNKPKVELQSETLPGTGQRVLTCYMLPQQPKPYQTEAIEEDTFPGPAWEEQRRARTLIKFAFEGDVDKPKGRLSRAPTPYPKELKALARHARNLSALQKDSKAVVPGAPQKDPARQFVAGRGSVGDEGGKVSQASVTPASAVTIRDINASPHKMSRESPMPDDEPSDAEIITSPLPVLAPQAEERPLMREARNVRNASAMNGQADTSNNEGSENKASERPYAIGDRKVFGLAQVVSTAKTPEDNNTPESTPLLVREAPKDLPDHGKDPAMSFAMTTRLSRDLGDRTDQDDTTTEEETSLTVKETPSNQQIVGGTTEDENNDTSSSSDSGYGNGKASQQQSVDEPQCSEGSSTTPSSPLHLTDPSISLPSTPSSPPSHIPHHHHKSPLTSPTSQSSPSPSSPTKHQPPTSFSTAYGSQPNAISRPQYATTTHTISSNTTTTVSHPISPMSLSHHSPTSPHPTNTQVPYLSEAVSVSTSRPLSLAPQQRLSHLSSNRPASIATGGHMEPSGGAKVARPGSLALGALADSALLNRVPQDHRPGSLAAPINTLGIPPAPARAASHMALNTTSNTPGRLHQHPMFRSQDLSRAGRTGNWQDSRPGFSTPHQESNGLVSIIDQVTREHDDSPPPKIQNSEPSPMSHRIGPHVGSPAVDSSSSGTHNFNQDQPGHRIGPQGGSVTGRQVDGSSGGPSNFTQDQPRGEVLHPTPHRPGLYNDSTDRPLQTDASKVSKLPSKIPGRSPDTVQPSRLNLYSSQPHTPQDSRIPAPHTDPTHTPKTSISSITSPTTTDARRISDSRIPTLSPGEQKPISESRIPSAASSIRSPGTPTDYNRPNWEPHRPAQTYGSGNAESHIPTPTRTLSNLSQESIPRKISPATQPDLRKSSVTGRSQIPRSPATPTVPQGPGIPAPSGRTTPNAAQGPGRQLGPGGSTRLQAPGYTGIRPPSMTPTSQLHNTTQPHIQKQPHTQTPPHTQPHTPTQPQFRPSYSGIRPPSVVNSAINTPGIPIPTSSPSYPQSQAPNLTSPGSRGSVTSTGSGSRIPHMSGGTASRLPGPGNNRHRVSPSAGQNSNPNTPDGRSVWMFGQHKNARVVGDNFPVVIEKNPDLGFTIGQSPTDPDDKSVYVTSVAGGGAASSALKVGDKLLQVDGADLRNASLPVAAAALANTSPTVNLMVSRLQ